jgi:hypothetical protein
MSDSTVIRCITLPVAVPQGDDPQGDPWTWKSFDAAILPAFRISTDLANWCVRRLFTLDHPVAKCPDEVKKWYGYKDASTHYPDVAKWAGAMASLNIVTRTVQRKYIQQRFDVMLRQQSSLLTYRFPQPFPIHNVNWKTDYTDGGFPTVRLALPGIGQVELRLKRRADFGRQLAGFRALHEGTAKKGEAALYKDHKGVLVLKMVGHFPRRERGEPTNVAFVHTDPHALLVVEINGRSVAITNADHIRREVAKDRSRSSCRNCHTDVVMHVTHRTLAHAAFRQRVGEDKKREVRMDRRQRANVNKAVEDRCDKQNHRIDTAVQQIAAQVARMCQRQGVGTVAFDGTNKEFLSGAFPHYALEERLKQLLQGEMGCAWIDGQYTHADTPEAAKDRREWLTTEQATQLLGTVPRVSRHKSRPPGTSHPGVSPPPET